MKRILLCWLHSQGWFTINKMHFFGFWQGALSLLVCSGFFLDSVFVTCLFYRWDWRGTYLVFVLYFYRWASTGSTSVTILVASTAMIFFYWYCLFAKCVYKLYQFCIGRCFWDVSVIKQNKFQTRRILVRKTWCGLGARGFIYFYSVAYCIFIKAIVYLILLSTKSCIYQGSYPVGCAHRVGPQINKKYIFLVLAGGFLPLRVCCVFSFDSVIVACLCYRWDWWGSYLMFVLYFVRSSFYWVDLCDHPGFLYGKDLILQTMFES